MTCNYCALEYVRARLAKEKRLLVLKASGAWIKVWSYRINAAGRSSGVRDEQCMYSGLTLHCSCDEDT